IGTLAPGALASSAQHADPIVEVSAFQYSPLDRRAPALRGVRASAGIAPVEVCGFVQGIERFGARHQARGEQTQCGPRDVRHLTQFRRRKLAQQGEQIRAEETAVTGVEYLTVQVDAPRE